LVRVAIIIVSYNVRSLLRQCLHSIAAQGGGAGYAVTTLVVDNVSSDGSAAMVAAEFPEVTLLTPPVNLGFTGGNNLALRTLGFPVTSSSEQSSCLDGANADENSPLTSPLAPRPSLFSEQATCLTGTNNDENSQSASPLAPRPSLFSHQNDEASTPPDYVLLLNPDAELTPGALPRMLDYLGAQPAVAVCGPQLRYGDGRFQHGAFRFPGLAQVALDVLPVAGLPAAHRLLDSPLNGRYPQTLWQGDAPFAVDFVLGAAMLVRGAALRTVGGLDEGYWMYCEEMDWCLRMWEHGWRVAALPTATVIHHAGQSSRQWRWPTFVQLWRSRYRFYLQHRDRYPAGFLLAARSLVRTGMACQARRARADFAAGRISGGDLGDALAAYQAVAQL
jgi:GT2 family glycosyltransferase